MHGGAIVSPQSYPTLSNVFADGIGLVATAQKTDSTSLTPWTFNQARRPAAPSSDKR